MDRLTRLRRRHVSPLPPRPGARAVGCLLLVLSAAAWAWALTALGREVMYLVGGWK